jgi:hypothetical protein
VALLARRTERNLSPPKRTFGTAAAGISVLVCLIAMLRSAMVIETPCASTRMLTTPALPIVSPWGEARELRGRVMAMRRSAKAAPTALDMFSACCEARGVHIRDMQRNVRLPGLVIADAIRAVCQALIDAGWLELSPARTGFQHKPRGIYVVSPRLTDALTERMTP